MYTHFKTVLSFRQPRSSTLLGLLLIAVLLYQFAAYNPTHTDDHCRHCCPACHAGHITATAGVRVVLVVPPDGAHRYNVPDSILGTSETFVVSGSSRAPPLA